MNGFLMASRTWGTGGINWRPGNVQASVNIPRYHHQQFTPRKEVPVRRVQVMRTLVDEEGRLTKEQLDIDIDPLVGDGMTVLELKQEICTKVGDVECGRLQLALMGRQLQDTQTLREADVPHDAELHVRILRRSAVQPGASSWSRAPTAQPPMRLTALRIRTLAGRSAVLTGLSDDMDVELFRALVMQHPLLQEEAEGCVKVAAEDGKKAAAKGAAAPAPEDQSPDGDAGLLLFGVGLDLDLDPGSEAKDPRPEMPLTTPRGTNGLVHLRDGRELRDYRMRHESVIYVCRDTK